MRSRCLARTASRCAATFLLSSSCLLSACCAAACRIAAVIGTPTDGRGGRGGGSRTGASSTTCATARALPLLAPGLDRLDDRLLAAHQDARRRGFGYTPAEKIIHTHFILPV
jgi:hypothetical protein